MYAIKTIKPCDLSGKNLTFNKKIRLGVYLTLAKNINSEGKCGYFTKF